LVIIKWGKETILVCGVGGGGRLSSKTLFIYVAGHADVLKRWLYVLIA